ncbi:unnamed protein product [Xylocopa violacea]|uniref:Uncharacterized protein n=1 Tax=Xylocopa violacea TaxID=135666 RepID=A0ABP1NLG4_XYLVO
MIPSDYYYANRANGWWSSPDGFDPLDKVISALKLGLFSGVSGGLLYAYANQKTIDHIATFGKIIKATVPICATSLVFISTSYVAARIRDKNDLINNLIGASFMYPIIRAYFPMCYSITLTSATMILLTITRGTNKLGTKPLDHTIPLYQSNNSHYDWYLWSKNKPPGEPYVKYKNDSGFFFGKV